MPGLRAEEPLAPGEEEEASGKETKKGGNMNRTDVMEVIQPLTGYQTRSVAPGAARVGIDQDRVWLRPSPRAQALEVAADGIKPLLSRIGLAEDVVRRLQPATFARVATESLAHQGHSLLVQDGRVVDLAPPNRFLRVDPERAITAVERGIRGEVDFHRILTLPHQTVQLEMVGVQEQPVSRGDLVRAGVMVRFSTTGAVTPMVQSYALRLTCTNGATSMDVMQEFSYGGRSGTGEGDDIWQWFRDSSRQAYASLGRIIARWQQMREEQLPAGDRAFVLTALLREAGIGRAEAEAVRAEALRNPPQNSYEMLQLLTWAASHVVERPQNIVRAQRAAASFSSTTEHHRLCPTCQTVR